MSKSSKMTPEAQENYMISLAYNLAEERMKAGTASAQEVVHFLKLGSTRNKAEIERLQKENKLLEAKAKSLNEARKSDEMFTQAIEAMKRYRGAGDDENYD